MQAGGLRELALSAHDRAPDRRSLPAPPPSERLRYIDALRAIAALLVVWLHAASTFSNASPETARAAAGSSAIPGCIDVGHIGVVVFFLISGFVIPFSILPDRAAPVGSFVIKRILRIYPAYWLSVPLAALVVFWIWGTPFATRELLINLTLLQDVFGVRIGRRRLLDAARRARVLRALRRAARDRQPLQPRRVALLAAALGLAFVANIAHVLAPAPDHDDDAPYWFLNLSVMLCGALLPQPVE